MQELAEVQSEPGKHELELMKFNCEGQIFCRENLGTSTGTILTLEVNH